MVILAMAAVWMTASLPAWKHNATREKEAELVFRGQQYVRALNLYQRKFGPGASPQSFDVLYDNKLLRKKYKDPITNDDFLPLYRSGTPQGPGQQQPAGGAQQPTGPGQGGALMGVQSKSTAASIMVYNGATHYNEWQFIMVAQQPQQGGPQRGGPGGGPAGGGPQRGLGPAGGGPGGPVRGGGPGRGPGVQPGPGRGGPPTGTPAGPGRGRGL
ncbi:MAG: hypothetical protein EPO35_11730 [Acidobacteria bacterium]|nr:MAG: hypothetical protein EPO35_11730 [Acidobacteriota bacterium]